MTVSLKLNETKRGTVYVSLKQTETDTVYIQHCRRGSDRNQNVDLMYNSRHLPKKLDRVFFCSSSETSAGILSSPCP
jgi:hypothetical protein